MKKSIFLVIIVLVLHAGCKNGESSAQQNGNTVLNYIPFKYYYNEILFQAFINDSGPFWIILDTGVSDLVINEKTVNSLGLPMGEVVDQGYTGIGEERIFETRINKVDIKIDSLENHFTDNVFAGKLGLIEAIMGHRVDGVFGRHLFEKYIIEIDYKNRIFGMYDPDNYSYKGSGKVVPLLIDGVPYIKATVILKDNKKTDGYFLVDTGSAGALSFTTKFCQEHNLYEEIGNTVTSIQSGGGGTSENRIGRIKAFIIGGYRIDNPIIALSNDTRGGMARSDIQGIIGNEIFSQFRVIIDYPGNRMILEPADSLNYHMEWDMSGIFIHAGGSNLDQFFVYGVLPGSPTDIAGIKAGDQIRFIDGLDVCNYSIDEIVKMFKLEKRQYKIGIIRDGKDFETKIILKKMI